MQHQIRRTFSQVLATSAVTALGTVGAQQAFAADAILQINDHTLTDYRASATGVQGVLPNVLGRGTRIDGTSRAGSTFPWSLAGNPTDPGGMGVSEAGVDLATGDAPVWDVHLALPAEGFRWIVGTSYSGAQKDGSSAHDSNGYQGRNWFQISQPEIVLYEHASDDTENVLYIVYGANRYAEFKSTNDPATVYKGVNGANGIVEFQEDGSGADLYVFTDQRGMVTTFFGFDGGASPAEGQLWTIEDPAGNVAYVGHATTKATAITDGFDGSGRIEYAYDTSGRRYEYGYTSIDSVTRLTSVDVDIKTGGDWHGTPTGVSEVASVDYGYYQTGSNTYGDNGCLKHVTVTMPLSESGVNDIRETYYRYWKNSFDTSTNPGQPYHLQYIVDPEGCRRFDYSDQTFDQDFFTASESALKPYASAYFEYEEYGSSPDEDLKVDKTWRNGECGCSGGNNGEHTIDYDEETSGFGSGYDQAWKSRAIVKQPDNAYITRYMDETGQALSRVVSDADPSSGNHWATEVERDVNGRVTAVDSPANVTYTHSPQASVDFANSASVGLITEFERETGSVHTKGFVTFSKVKVGTSGTANYTSATAWGGDTSGGGQDPISETISSVALYRAKVIERSTYPDYETSSGSGKETTSLNEDPKGGSKTLATDTMTVTRPDVSDANNGDTDSVGPASATAYRDDRTGSFTKSADGIISYTQHTNGQPTKQIRDADTSLTGTGEDFEFENAPTGFTSDGSGDEHHIVTTMAYDAQGRRETTTMYEGTSDERTSRTHYTRLADRRLVTISIPREWDDGGTTTYDGPVSYRVTNHAGQVEAQATIALSGNSSTTALTAWIDDADDDVITAVDEGSLFRLTASVYNESGGQVTESRVFFDNPATYPGTEGTNYDATFYLYDNMGRRVGVKDPTGTISHTVHDAIGRVSETWIGTDDTGDPDLAFEFGGGSTSDMVRTSLTEYDSGSSGGNSLVNKVTQYVEDSTTDKRETTYTYDGRGRRVLTTNPQSPHIFVKLDNIGRTVAAGLYSDISSIDISADDPAGTSSDDILHRIGLVEQFYDEQSRVYKSNRWGISPSTGAKLNSLTTDLWYDDEGQIIKIQGSTFEKYAYDRLDRKTHTYVIGGVNDSSYGDADDVSSDAILQENQTLYDPVTGYVLAQVQIDRHHDDYGSSEHRGALDSTADGDDLLITAANLNGRPQITSYWYDDLGRRTDTVRYGTNGGSNFDRDGLSVPATSDNTPRTITTFGDNGLVETKTDPLQRDTEYMYDDSGRKILVIANEDDGTPSGINGDDDVHTRYTYTDGLMTSLHVDLDGVSGVNGDDQVTTYTYGVSKGASAGDSEIGSGRLLATIAFSDSTGASDVVSFAYNAQGQEIWKKDQAGNIIETKYDTGGRPVHRAASTIDADFDSTVQRISTTYADLGMVETVSSYDDDAIGSGSVLNEVKHTYNGWGELITLEQDRDSAVGASGSVNDYEITYGYSSISLSGGRQARVRDEQTLPSGADLEFNWDAINGMDQSEAEAQETGRIEWIKVDGVKVAEYEYNGVQHLVRTDLPEIDVFHTLAGTTSGSYDKLDRFNRIIEDRWTKDLATDVHFYNVDIAYNRVGNITSVDDQVYKDSSSNGVFDYEYTHDDLNRITQAERGNWNGSSISVHEENEAWTLYQTGNWNNHRLDLNGDTDYLDTDELDDDRTYNKANELTAQDIDDDGTNDFTLTYDEAGNLADDGENYEYVYDAFGRLAEVTNRSTSSAVTQYKYNGLGWRIYAINDSDADGSMGDETPEHLAYDEQWRLIAIYDGSTPVDSPREQYVHHRAGLDGKGSASYLDRVLLRVRDTTGGLPDTLDERVYYVQNWRADIVALLSGSGEQLEQVRYSAYGVPFLLLAGDVHETFGQVDLDDTGQFTDWINASVYDVRGDLDLDGDVDGSDASLIMTGSSGRGVLSGAVTSSALGYASKITIGTIGLVDFRYFMHSDGLAIGLNNYRIGSLPDETAALATFGNSFLRNAPLRSSNLRLIIHPLRLGRPWSNIDFLQHYINGEGESVNLNVVGRGGDYLDHEAVQAAMGRIGDNIRTQLEPIAQSMMGSLACCCYEDGPRYKETIVIPSGREPVAREDFVRIDFPLNPFSFDFWAFWYSDWTFSLGGHGIDWEASCNIEAECSKFNINIRVANYNCWVNMSIQDIFTDPFDTGDLWQIPIDFGVPYEIWFLFDMDAVGVFSKIKLCRDPFDDECLY